MLSTRQLLRVFIPFAIYQDTRDKTLPVWQRILYGVISVAFLLVVLGVVADRLFHASALEQTLDTAGFSLIGIVIVIALVMLAVQTVRQRRTDVALGKTPQSAGRTLWHVFLFLFLPCMVITVALVGWAILTKQPGF